MIRILIADDHPIVRQGLVQLLSEESDFEVAGEAADGAELMEQVGRGGWDVVILDLSMPGVRGLELVRTLARQAPDLPVVVLSIHPAEQYAARSIQSGAAAYLNKQTSPEELVAAVRQVAGGERYLPPEVSQLLLDEAALQDQEEAPHEKLSRREYQVFQMIASGKAVGDIGRELGLSVKTVSTYRARLLAKMGLRTNAELTHYAFQNQLLD
jgi:two-component system, NarL family, invasion response regulator UvrY